MRLGLFVCETLDGETEYCQPPSPRPAREKAGVPACRGAGDQGDADRDTRTDQSASAGTWPACFEGTGIWGSYGVV